MLIQENHSDKMKFIAQLKARGKSIEELCDLQRRKKFLDSDREFIKFLLDKFEHNFNNLYEILSYIDDPYKHKDFVRIICSKIPYETNEHKILLKNWVITKRYYISNYIGIIPFGTISWQELIDEVRLKIKVVQPFYRIYIFNEYELEESTFKLSFSFDLNSFIVENIGLHTVLISYDDVSQRINPSKSVLFHLNPYIMWCNTIIVKIEVLGIIF